jgi:hypothetical protein
VKKPAIVALYFVYALALMNSCSKSREEGVTCRYSSDIKPLVARKCAVAGCHNGSTGLVNFTDDATLKLRADNGRIRSYVFELKIMPPAGADSLTTLEKEQLKCWLDGGAVQD